VSRTTRWPVEISLQPLPGGQTPANPFASKSQVRKFFAMEGRGELPKGTAEEWAHETKNIKKLPERKKKN